MKSRFALTLAAFTLASPAYAWNVTPPGAFTGDGVINVFETVGPNLQCAFSVSGTVSAKGVARISRATTNCPTLIQPTGLPWFIRPTTATRARFPAASFAVTVLGSCGPAPIRLELTAPGAFKMKITHMASGVPGSCKVWGNFTTTPALTITP